MNLPDAPIAPEGFFATHFFTVKDQERSRDFYVRILGGKLIKTENPCYIKLANSWIILNSGGGPNSRQAGSHPPNTAGSQPGQQLSQPARRQYLGLLQTMERKGRDVSYRAARKSRRLGVALLHA